MRIRHSIYYTAILSLFVAAPILAAESISQIQSLQGQVWVQRGDEKIEANSASEIYSGDLISTSDTGRLKTLLWSRVNLKLDGSSKIVIFSDANKKGKDASVTQKIIKLEYGASCIEIDHLMDSPVLFQIGDRVTINFLKPVELCLSTDAVKSHIQLSKGSAKLMHLSNSMVIALNEPGSEISFFNGGIFSLLSPSRASPQVIPLDDPKEFSKSEDLKESSKTVDLNAPSKPAGRKDRSKSEDLKEPPKPVNLKVPSKTEVPIALSKTAGPKELSKSEDLKESPKSVDLKAHSKTAVPIALSKTENLKESSRTVDLKVPSKIEAPVALSKIKDPKESAKANNTKELYNVYLNSSRSYEATAAVNRRLRDSGYNSVVIDEIDNKGPLFRISVPNFETVAAARGFVDKVVVKLGIHDAWIERYLKEFSKTEERKASSKKERPKDLSKTEQRKEPYKSVDLNVPSRTKTPIALSKTDRSKELFKIEAPVALPKTVSPKEPSKTKNPQELYDVYLNSSRSYEATAAVYRRLRDSGYSSFVIDEIDNKGPLFRVSVPNFETVTAAREFVDKVVVKLGIHDAWIERQQSKK